jgi:putative hydrolase of the HAD superfamily
MKQYQCVLFDLDHTLWDYVINCSEALDDLYHRYGLSARGVPTHRQFHETFTRVNNELWDKYDRGLIHRDVIRLERFHRVFMEFGLDDMPMSLKVSGDYLKESPTRGNLIPHAKEILDYLFPTYPLFVITNGFDEIQATKLSSSGIEKYFKKVFTSEKVGHKKPSREIFDHVLKEFGFQSHQAIMIGDNLLTDIAGARNADVDQVFFNPEKIAHDEKVTYEISRLEELRNIL